MSSVRGMSCAVQGPKFRGIWLRGSLAGTWSTSPRLCRTKMVEIEQDDDDPETGRFHEVFAFTGEMSRMARWTR